MHAAASIESSAAGLGTGMALASGRPAGVDRDEAACLDDAVEGAAIRDEVPYHRKGFRPPGLDRDGRAVLEMGR